MSRAGRRRTWQVRLRIEIWVRLDWIVDDVHHRIYDFEFRVKGLV